jgi:hypothetical protein
MRASVCGVLVLMAVASLVPSMLGQVNKINSPDPQIMLEVFSKAQPYTVEQRVKAVLTHPDGSTAGGFEEKQVISGDSQGRLLFAVTRMKNGAAVGATIFTLDDHAAGTRTGWSTENNLAKMQKFPEGDPERSSCWVIAPEEQTLTWRMYKLLDVKCRPAAEHYCAPFGAVLSIPVALFSDGSSAAKGSYQDCRESLSRPPTQNSERKDEDLGTERILGFETHGCRGTWNTPEGTTVVEKWVAEFGLEGSRKPIVLRSVSESPYFDGSAKLTAKVRIETISSNLDEPAPAALEPPTDYKIETVDMHEIPCE